MASVPPSSSEDPNINVAPPAQEQHKAEKQQHKGDNKGKAPNPNKANPNKKKSGPVPLGPLPAFIDERIKIWDEYKKKREEELSSMPS